MRPDMAYRASRTDLSVSNRRTPRFRINSPARKRRPPRNPIPNPSRQGTHTPSPFHLQPSLTPTPSPPPFHHLTMTTRSTSRATLPTRSTGSYCTAPHRQHQTTCTRTSAASKVAAALGPYIAHADTPTLRGSSLARGASASGSDRATGGGL
jgi:hypothetical protein